MHIYLVTNSFNDKLYIGAKVNYDPEYFGSGRLISEAREGLGEENFKKEILIDDIDDWEECKEIESYFIMGLNTLVPNGYNQEVFAWPPSIEMSRKGGKKVAEEKIGMFSLKERIKAEKHSAPMLFEIDGLIQQTTLGAILRETNTVSEESEEFAVSKEMNVMCKRCIHECKQSEKVEIIICPEFERYKQAL